VNDPAALLYHNEPIWRGSKIVGRITSGMYGHTVGSALGMGYVQDPDLNSGDLAPTGFEVEIAGRRIATRASLRPFYDATNRRVRDLPEPVVADAPQPRYAAS
jgi:4-methylaminobutanoate oxidase (formaldehyde-forming)